MTRRDYERKFQAPKEKWSGKTKKYKSPQGDEGLVLPFMWDDSKHPQVERAKHFYSTAQSVVEEMNARREELRKTERYTEKGLQAKLGALTYEKEIPSLLRAENGVSRLKTELAERKATLKLPDIDRKDVVAEMQRAELRAMIRAKPDSDRRMWIESQKQNSPEQYEQIIDAIISAPAELSGVGNAFIDLHRGLRMEKIHGPALDEIAELEDIVTNSARALDVAREELRGGLGLTPAEFDHLTAPVRKGVSALKFHTAKEEINGEQKEVTRVLDIERGVWRVATEDEMKMKDAA